MADAIVTPTATPLLFGRYRVLEQLGESRLAAVYTASDERLHRRVLLHLMRKELVGQERSRSRFLSEIGESARRSHQALLEVFDSGEAASRPFMVTEYVSGRSLRNVGLLTVEQALLYMRQLAGAVAVCQAQRSPTMPLGLYHPPISSNNVLLVDEGRVKLVDSWQLGPGDLPLELAHYRAPELSEGLAATPASTVYALGLLLYELITGVRPISAADAHATALAHLQARIPPMAQSRPTLYLPAVEQLVAKATARFPEQRYADAQLFGEALDTLWRDLGASTQRLGPPARPARGRRLEPSAVAAEAAPQIDDPDQPLPAPLRQPRPSGLTGFSFTGRFARTPSVDPDVLRKRNFTRGAVGWLVMICLLLLVAAASYVGVNAIADRIGGLSGPNLPSLPSLPSLPNVNTGNQGPLSWVRNLFGRDETYIVNLAEGLNLRSQPDVDDPANIISVVPNGTPVRKLEGPVVEDSINWLRVEVETDGQRLQGWMSLAYLRQEQ